MFATMPAAGIVRVHGDPEQPVPAISDHRLLSEAPAAAVEALVEVSGPGSGSPLLFTELRQMGGAYARAPEGGGAVAAIEEPFLLFALGLAMDPDMGDAAEAHSAKTCDAMEQWASSRCYLNFVEREGESSVGFSDDAYARLREVKAKVDPDRLFQSNHDIG